MARRLVRKVFSHYLFPIELYSHWQIVVLYLTEQIRLSRVILFWTAFFEPALMCITLRVKTLFANVISCFLKKRWSPSVRLLIRVFASRYDILCWESLFLHTTKFVLCFVHARSQHFLMHSEAFHSFTRLGTHTLSIAGRWGHKAFAAKFIHEVFLCWWEILPIRERPLK